MKLLSVLSIAVVLLTGCKSTEELKPISQIKPTISKEGSLANEKLILDVTVGLRELTGQPINSSELLKFIIQQPVGDIGSRSWREMWIVKQPDRDVQFLLTFKETGLDSASFEVIQMDKNLDKTQCPNNVTGFPIGVATSDDVLSCMGKPGYEDYNPDGRFVYLYNAPQGAKITFLFGKDKKLIETNVYKKSDY
ncbi:YjgB family protein [Shewanella submarina]|uniref:YjgB family protein n=1 Tax=Shewanella submarina TaxID=2016376 RepID=A0ABV7GEN8_9GAMM|nr:YjgB family protein [Shewanella submarina]MCL1038915.1 YjgB family protein [Shewanella submarina]